MPRDTRKTFDLENPLSGNSPPLVDSLTPNLQLLGQSGESAGAGSSPSDGELFGAGIVFHAPSGKLIFPSCQVTLSLSKKSGKAYLPVVGTLGDEIKRRRNLADLSQTALAKKLGVTRNAVTNWEKNKNAPATTKLLQLAEIFGCSVEDITGGITPELTRIERAIRSLRQLPPESSALVIDGLENLLAIVKRKAPLE